jgi:hypothetical protein
VTSEAATSWLFEVPGEPRSAWSVVLWWEKRRPAYNGILLLVGIPLLVLFHVFVDAAGVVPPGEDPVENFVVLASPIVANVFYTAGWFVEANARIIHPGASRRLGPRLLKLGIGFTLAVMALPSAIWGMVCLVQLLNAPDWEGAVRSCLQGGPGEARFLCPGDSTALLAARLALPAVALAAALGLAVRRRRWLWACGWGALLLLYASAGAREEVVSGLRASYERRFALDVMGAPFEAGRPLAAYPTRVARGAGYSLSAYALPERSAWRFRSTSEAMECLGDFGWRPARKPYAWMCVATRPPDPRHVELALGPAPAELAAPVRRALARESTWYAYLSGEPAPSADPAGEPSPAGPGLFVVDPVERRFYVIRRDP